MRAVVFVAVFQNQATIAGYDLRQTITYSWLTQSLIYDGSLDEIRGRFGTERTLVVDLDDDVRDDEPLDVANASQIRADGPRRWLRFNRGAVSAADLIAAVTARYRIRDLSLEEPAIEGIIRRIYEEGTAPVEG